MSDVSHSSLYGSGVFTTIRIIDGEPWLWDKHWRRLMHDAAAIGITSRLSEDQLLRDLKEKISSSGLSSAKARITISDERSSPLWNSGQGDEPPSISILNAPLRELPARFRLGISPFPVNSASPIAGLKTCNYLDQVMALRRAMGDGLNEAVRLNERGHVISGCMANIFWLKDAQLYTPALSTRCLPGTTRDRICESLDVSEVEVGIDALTDADALFLTSAGLGIVGANEFDGREMPLTDHDIQRIIPTQHK